jgi:hypothetical protein
MPSTVLVQRPKEQAQVAEEDLAVRIVSVESRIGSISITNPGRDSQASGARAFDFEVDLSESGRAEDGLSVRYKFAIGRPSSGQACRMSGTAVVRFSRSGTGSDFHHLGNDVSNMIAVEIFRKEYEAVYLLHDALGIAAPSPWITQDVSLCPRNRALGETGDD